MNALLLGLLYTRFSRSNPRASSISFSDQVRLRVLCQSCSLPARAWLGTWPMPMPQSMGTGGAVGDGTLHSRLTALHVPSG